MGQVLLEPRDTRIGVSYCLKHKNAESDILAAHLFGEGRRAPSP